MYSNIAIQVHHIKGPKKRSYNSQRAYRNLEYGCNDSLTIGHCGVHRSIIGAEIANLPIQ